MTDEDRLQYLEVLFALSGVSEREEQKLPKTAHEITHENEKTLINKEV